MGLNHPRGRKAIDPNRCRTPVPILGPIEEVSESEVFEDRTQRRRASQCSPTESDALVLTFCKHQQKPVPVPKMNTLIRLPVSNRVANIRSYRRTALSPTPVIREPTKYEKKPASALRERVVRRVDTPAAVPVPSSTEPPSPTHSQENPSLHLTSSSSGISKESTKEEREKEPKRRTYGQLATLMKCRQVIVAATRHRAKLAKGEPEKPSATVKLLSPRAVVWNNRGFHVRKSSNTGTTSPRELVNVEENKKETSDRTPTRLSGKPPLYAKKRKSVQYQIQIQQQNTIYVGNQIAGTQEPEKSLKRTQTMLRGERDLEPLASRIKSWSKKCNVEDN